MPNLIVSTCGTSLLTNGADGGLRRLLITHANAREQDMAESDRGEIDAWVEERRQYLLRADDEQAARLSAEINGLLAYYRGDGVPVPADHRDQHYLLVTDTYLGQRASGCISQWLERRFGQPATRVTAGGLNTSDIADFRAALADIVMQLDNLDLSAWREQGYRVVFNLTGGFKSVNGFMQTIGMLFADECFYLFEGSRELMRVPRLPIRLDAATAFEDNLDAVRRMANGKELTRADCGSLPGTLLFEVSEDAVQLSEWGMALWIAVRPGIYGERLMDPLSDRLRFFEAFRGKIGGRKGILAESSRLHTLNCRLDELARCLDSNGGHNPNRLDFKQIRGNPRPSSTHEFDIWSDRSDRGYGHYETVDNARVFVVETIGGHL